MLNNLIKTMKMKTKIKGVFFLPPWFLSYFGKIKNSWKLLKPFTKSKSFFFNLWEFFIHKISKLSHNENSFLKQSTWHKSIELEFSSTCLHNRKKKNDVAKYNCPNWHLTDICSYFLLQIRSKSKLLKRRLI